MSKKANDKLIEASRMGDLVKVKMLINAGVDVNAADEEMHMTPLHHAADRGNLEVCRLLLAEGANLQARAVMGHTPFTLACCQGLYPVVQWLLKSGSNVEESDDAGFTGLHGASRHGKMDTVIMLVAAGANINVTSNQGYSPLFYACRGGHLDICIFLHNHGADLHLRTHSGNSLLTFTCYNGLLPVIKWLVESGCDVNESDNQGETGLHRACQTGDINIVQYLLSQGANVNIRSKHGRTPLHLAAENNQIDVFNFMLTENADISSRDNDGDTPLNLAICKGHLNVWLTGNKFQIKGLSMDTLCSALCKASMCGNLQVVKYLVEQGVDISTADQNGYTAIHHATAPGHLELCKYLHANNLGVDVKTMEGYTPLMLACYHGQLPTVKWLIEKGADIHVTDNNGYTAIHHASAQGHLELCEYLHSEDFPLGQKTADGFTPLMSACYCGQLSVVQWLVSHSVDTKETDSKGLTALHHAAKQGKLVVCRYLHSKGAPVDTTDKDGNTLLSDASIQGHLPVVKWLVKNSCDVLQHNIHDKTPLTLALENERKEVALCLLEHLIDKKKLQSIISTKPTCTIQGTNRIITELGEEVIKLQTQLAEQREINAYLVNHINGMSGTEQQANVPAIEDGQLHTASTTASPAVSTSSMEPGSHEGLMLSSADSAYSSQPENAGGSTPGSDIQLHSAGEEHEIGLNQGSDVPSSHHHVGHSTDVVQLTGEQESQQTTLSAVLMGEDGNPVGLPPGVSLVPVYPGDTPAGGPSNVISGYVVQNTVTRSVKVKESTYSDTVISVNNKSTEKPRNGEEIQTLKVQNKSLQNKVKHLEGQLRTKDSKDNALQALKIMERSTMLPYNMMPTSLQPSSTLTQANEELAKYIRQVDINHRVVNAHSATHLTLMLLREKYSEDQLKDHSAVGAGKSNRPPLNKDILAAITGFVRCVYPTIPRPKLITAINQACSDARKRGRSKLKGDGGLDTDEQPSKKKAEDKDT